MNWDKMKSALLEPLDLYCERTDASLMSEPFNFASNFAFYLAAARIIHIRQSLRSPLHRGELKILAWLAVLVGTGSAFFHSWATRLSQIADVVPIAIFVAVSLFFYVRNLHLEGVALRTPLVIAGFTLCAPVLLAKLMGLTDYLAKGDSYLGIAPTLVVFALYERMPERRSRLFLAAGLFLCAFTFRTLDVYICDIFPNGSHFMWHVLTTLSAYLMASIQAVTGRKLQN